MAENGKKPNTQARLLESASYIFAEKGFRDATIAEICERAGANLAAVNYYFRSKEKLYIEAWRSAFEEAIRKHPPEGDAEETDPPEKRLRARMAAFIGRALDRDNRDFDIMRR